MNNELEGVWEEAVVAYVESLWLHLAAGIQDCCSEDTSNFLNSVSLPVPYLSLILLKFAIVRDVTTADLA
jgi:hypothetical protein